VAQLISFVLGNPNQTSGAGAFVATSMPGTRTLSADGEVALFRAQGNLSGFDTNSQVDVYLWNAALPGVTALVSHAAASTTMAGTHTGIEAAQISGDGRWVVFTSDGADHIVGQFDGGGDADVFLYEVATGAIALVSHVPGVVTTGAQGESESASLPHDAAFVAFESRATDLVAGTDGNGNADVFLYDRSTAAVTRLSGNAGVAWNNRSDSALAAADGSVVVFRTDATNYPLPPGFTDSAGGDLIRYDVDAGTYDLVTRRLDGTSVGSIQGGLTGDRFVLSADGRYVVYTSSRSASLIVSGTTDTNTARDVFRYDSQTDTTILVSRGPNATTASNRQSVALDVSDDGNVIVFASRGNNFAGIADPNNTGDDIFVFDALANGGAGSVTLVSHTAASLTTTGDAGAPVQAGGPFASITGDGATILHVSDATNIAPAGLDTNGAADVFRYTRATGMNELISTAAAGTASGNAASGPGALARVTGDIVYQSAASDLVEGVTDPGGASDVFLVDVAPPPPPPMPGAPAIAMIASNAAAGTYGPDGLVQINVQFDELVQVTGTPTLTLDSGGVATFDAVFFNTATFLYTPGPGEESADLDVTAVNLNGGSIVAVDDGAAVSLALPAGNNLADNAMIAVDAVGPRVMDVTSPTLNGTYGVGDTIIVRVQFDEPIEVIGVPQLTLETGMTDAVVNFSSVVNGDTLTFLYTVASGHASPDLDYVSTAALALNGATIRDTSVGIGSDFGMANDADLTLPAPGAVGSLGFNKAIVVDTGQPPPVAPAILGIDTDAIAGTYGPGAVVQVAVEFDEAVDVTGAPTLLLDSGGVASYAGTMAPSTLLFTYVVDPGQSSADLNVTGLQLNGGAIVASDDGTAAGLAIPAGNNLADNAAIAVDGVGPVVVDVTSPDLDQIYGVGDTIAVTVRFDEAVAVVGTPTLTLETGAVDAVVPLAAAEGDTLTFAYTVAAGHASPDLDYVSAAALALAGGTIRDVVDVGVANDAATALAAPGAAGSLAFNKDLVVDTAVPTVIGVTSPDADGFYNAGDVVTVVLRFSEAVDVVGMPSLALDSGGTATFAGGALTDALAFTYTVMAGEDSADLDVTGVVLDGGAITDAAGAEAAILTLAAPGTAGSLSAERDIVVDTTAPTIVDLEAAVADGVYGVGAAIALVVAFSEDVAVTGTPHAAVDSGAPSVPLAMAAANQLTFAYTVGAGEASDDLDLLSILLGGGTIRDAAGNPTMLAVPAPGAAGSISLDQDVAIDTAQPVLMAVTSPDADGAYAAGDALTLRLHFDAPVAVTGAPTLALDSGGVATFSGGGGTDTLTFAYTVGAGQDSDDLDVTGVVLGGGAITATTGTQPAILTLPAPDAPGSLSAERDIVVDTMAPTVVDLEAAVADGTYGPGAEIPLVVTFSEAVTVTGMPLATVDSGAPPVPLAMAAANQLTFAYTVGAGEASDDLDLLSVLLGGGTIRDAAGNAAALAVPAPGAPGSISTDQAVVVGDPGANSAPFFLATVADAVTTWHLDAGPFGFIVADAEDDPSTLAVTATSSNQDVLPDGNIVLGGAGAERTVLFDPVAFVAGTATVTLTVTDPSGAGAVDTVLVTVEVPLEEVPPPVPDVPSPPETPGQPGGGDPGAGDDNDLFVGGPGPDLFDGMGGNDTAFGNGAGDWLIGGLDLDSLLGGAGGDALFGGQGDDTLAGDAGADLLLAGRGRDLAYGGQGDDVVHGNRGDDTVNGNQGDDQVRGGQGNDVVRGGQGNDAVFGDLGDDLVKGDLGDDILTGGMGRDTFCFADGSGLDVITDFDAGEDAIRIDLTDGQINGLAIPDFAAFLARASETADGVFVDLNGDPQNGVMILGATLADLRPDNVLFV